MKQINRNNFFTWYGEFEKAVATAQANNDSAQFTKGAASLVIYPLENDTAVFGVNANSFEFTFQDNGANPAVWDAIAKKITYYPPDDAVPGEIRQLKYRWTDINGTVSNEATINIAVNEAATYWRAVGTSLYCVQDAGENTGMAAYATLEKAYVATDLPYTPATTKDNVDTDPDYIPPFENHDVCPLPVTALPHTLQFIALTFEMGIGYGRIVHAELEGTYVVEDDVEISGVAISYYPAYAEESYLLTIPAGTRTADSAQLFDDVDTDNFVFKGTQAVVPEESKAAGANYIVDLKYYTP